MLYTIDNNGTIQWHCMRHPTCSFHNCCAWDPSIQCVFHSAAQRQQPPGRTHAVHLSDPDVKWVSAAEIELPACPECKAIMTIRVHDDEELIPPVITRHETTGEILQVAPHPHPKFSGNLWFVRADTITTQEPHPTLAHLSSEQIRQMQDDIRSKAKEAPVEWMLTSTTQQVIHEVYPHPAVERHRELARQLRAAGKVPPQQVEEN